MKTKLPTTIGEMEWALGCVANVSCFNDETRAALRYAHHILAITRNYLGHDTSADDATRNLEVALSKHCASKLCQSNEI
jgi:hypothetical protein